MGELLRVYFDPDEIGQDGYPFLWHRGAATFPPEMGGEVEYGRAIKDLVREQAGHRCVRCGHPFVVGESSMMVPHPLGDVDIDTGKPVLVNASWCDERCTHGGPLFAFSEFGTQTEPRYYEGAFDVAEHIDGGFTAAAIWRILTVHHLNGVKHDCRWWNLAALCQRCHLVIQAKVHLSSRWTHEHSDWFKPYAAGYYASALLGEDLTRNETFARLDELLALEDRQLTLDVHPGPKAGQPKEASVI